MNKLNCLFNPKSIAIIGASKHKEKLGHQVLKNIIEYGFKGKIYPINIDPKVKRILNLPSFTSVLKIKEKIDLAIIIIPAKFVPQALEECGKKGIDVAVIISAGFKEIGKKGAELEEEIVKIGKKYGIRIVGPNCLGVIIPVINLNASFAGTKPLRGEIALVSQSGAMGTAALDWAQASNLGFSRFISLGNKADVSEAEILQLLTKDKKTKVVMVYLEGIEKGWEFREAAQKLSRKKPLIILKAGKTEAGRKAIASHTGALASSPEATKAVFKQTGIIEADNLEEFFDFAEGLIHQPLPKRDRIAVLTNAGGPGVMAAESLEKEGLTLAKIREKTKTFLEKKLSPSASLKNPIDLVGDAKAFDYEVALYSLIKDKNVDGLIVILTPQTATEIEKTARTIVKFSKLRRKPILASFIGGNKVLKGIKILQKNRVPHFEFPERAVKVMATLVKAKRAARRKKKLKEIKIRKEKIEKIKKIIVKAKEKGCNFLSSEEAERVLKEIEIPVLKSRLAKNEKEAIKIAKEIGYPLVLKIESPVILHKYRIGGVKINIKNLKELKRGYREILKNVKSKLPKAEIKGITLSKMIGGGKEIILGIKRDPSFGPVLMFGLGGVYVEILKDVSFRLAPISKEDAKEMVSEIKAFSLLEGFGEEKTSDIDALIKTILKLSQFSLNFPEIKEIDLNPIKIFEKGKGLIVLDAKILI